MNKLTTLGHVLYGVISNQFVWELTTTPNLTIIYNGKFFGTYTL